MEILTFDCQCLTKLNMGQILPRGPEKVLIQVTEHCNTSEFLVKGKQICHLHKRKMSISWNNNHVLVQET